MPTVSHERRGPRVSTCAQASGRPGVPFAATDVPGGLEYRAYSARYFPGRRPRHDFRAVVAYGAYRGGFRGAPVGSRPIEPAGGRYAPVKERDRAAPPSVRAGDALERAALQAWEGEGGAIKRPGQPGPPLER
jgi:hypothetical protein